MSVRQPDLLYAGVDEPGVKTAKIVLQKTLETQPSNRSLRWQGGNGLAVTITPLRTFKIKTGHFCRDYREVVVVGSIESTDHRTACRKTDGSWVRVNAF